MIDRSLIKVIDLTVTNLKKETVPNIAGIIYPLVPNDNLSDILICAPSLRITYGEYKSELLDFSKGAVIPGGIELTEGEVSGSFSSQTNTLKLKLKEDNLKLGYTLRLTGVVSLFRSDKAIFDKDHFDYLGEVVNNPSLIKDRQTFVL